MYLIAQFFISDSENENVKNGQAENKAESRSKSTSRKGKKKDGKFLYM